MTLSHTTTPGRIHLHEAIAYDVPGTKFIRVAYCWNGTTTIHSTDVLHGGGSLLIAGDAEAQLAPIIDTLDTALRRGAALLEIVTEPVAPSAHLTIQRYYIYGGRHRTDAASNAERFVHDPHQLAGAERSRRASQAAALRRVQHEVDEREAERERSEARCAREMKTRAFWLRRHRDHLGMARGARRVGEHKWHAYALNAAAFDRTQAAAIPA
ncbi:hypothetical protein [Streptomyces lydicus]|uniref:hypothetical protein n=1 Tax=Streptomyces lydicus TaxID=47763 RepID=UPI0010132C3B|nr:hypothetical protein [Streptomyces lydicus]MCZ1012013.1 hypothetical protein [Streptomyces lydicus]